MMPIAPETPVLDASLAEAQELDHRAHSLTSSRNLEIPESQAHHCPSLVRIHMKRRRSNLVN